MLEKMIVVVPWILIIDQTCLMMVFVIMEMEMLMKIAKKMAVIEVVVLTVRQDPICLVY